MRIKYDPLTDTLTIRFTDHPIAERNELEPGLIADYDASGNVIGAELRDITQAIERQLTETLESSFRQAWHEVMTGQTKPISGLWKELEDGDD